MLLDNYFLPLIEISISVVLPLILTLKTLQITNNPSANDTYSKHVLRYWMIYWFLFSFIQSVGTNNHVRLCFSLFYMAQHNAISPYLIEFYQVSLVPQISSLSFKIMNFRITEDDVDKYATYTLEQICFNEQIVDKLLSIVKLGSGNSKWNATSITSNERSHRKLSNFFNSTSTFQNQTASNNDLLGTPENIIPLEIQKPRNVKSNSTKLAKHSDESLDQRRNKKRSNDNLRARSSSTSNGNLPATASSSRKSSKVQNNNSRTVSNDDIERDADPEISYAKENFGSSSGPSNFSDSGANLLVHGFNGDPLNKLADSTSSQNTLLRTEKDRPSQERSSRGLKNFFTVN